jgi:hypothetical protein
MGERCIMKRFMIIVISILIFLIIYGKIRTVIDEKRDPKIEVEVNKQ